MLQYFSQCFVLMAILGSLGLTAPVNSNLLQASTGNVALATQSNKAIDPVLMDPILDFVISGEKLHPQRFIELFGAEAFYDPRPNQMMMLFAQQKNPRWGDVLSILGSGNPRFLHLVHLIQQGSALSGEDMLELLGGGQDPKVPQLLALIQGGNSLNALEVLKLFGHDGRNLLSLVSLADQNQPLDIGRVIELVGVRDPELATIAHALSGGGKLNVQQILKLLEHSVHPKVAALVFLVGQRKGNISLYDLIEPEGALAYLLKEQSKREILAVITSSDTISRIFKRHSRVPFATLVADSHFLHLSSLLNEKGQQLLQRVLQRSRSSRELFASKGKFVLVDIISDDIMQLAGDGE